MTVNTCPGALHPPPPHHISSPSSDKRHYHLYFLPNKPRINNNSTTTRVALGQDRVRISPPYPGIRGCFGEEGLTYSPLENPGKQGMRKMTGENKEHFFHKVNMVANLGNGNTANYKEIMSNRESKKVFYPGDIRTTLVGILEVLASFDEYGIFLNHLQDSSSSKYSDIHKKPMGFSMMRKKIESHGYTSWKSFVDDFEHVCYDAMSYYRKHAALWNAANDMLHNGSAYLDEMAEKADGFLASFCKAERNVAQELDASNTGDGTRGKAVIFEMNLNNSKCDTELICGGAPENVSIQSVGKKDVQELEIDATVERSLNLLCSTPCARSLGNIQGLLKNCSTSDIGLYNTSGSIVEADDTMVDILRCVEDDVRFDSPEQATESSSSFGETDIDDDYKETCGSGQSKPQLCNGNLAAPVMEDCDHVSAKRVSDDWKSCRRGIEWRCRWLELQIKEFQSRASCYDQKLEEIQATKLGKDHAHFIKAPAARAASLICHYQGQRILHRKPKKVRDVENLSTYMSQHPLFSLYEHRNRVEVDGRPVDDDFHCTPATGELKSSISDESDFNGQLGQAGATSENSVELMLWKIENLQSRITKMKNRLNKLAYGKPGKIFTKSLAHNSLSTGSPKGAVQATVGPSSHQSRIHMCVGGGSKVQPGSSLSRRRTSEFDISNIIMPRNTMATYVEPVRHAFIEIPQWRLVDETITLDKPGGKDSSEEVTDDEVYTKHHKDMEIKEKHLRGFPHPARKCPLSSNKFGKGTLIGPLQSLVTTEKEICTRSAQGNVLPSNCFPWDISIPKGKRKGKRSRPSSVQVVEVANAAELEDTTMTPNDGHGMR